MLARDVKRRRRTSTRSPRLSRYSHVRVASPAISDSRPCANGSRRFRSRRGIGNPLRNCPARRCFSAPALGLDTGPVSSPSDLLHAPSVARETARCVVVSVCAHRRRGAWSPRCVGPSASSRRPQRQLSPASSNHRPPQFRSAYASGRDHARAVPPPPPAAVRWSRHRPRSPLPLLPNRRILPPRIRGDRPQWQE